MAKMRLWRLGIAATLAVLLSILAGFLGCGNQPSAGYPRTATLAPPPTATPILTPTVTVTPTPTPTPIPTRIIVGNHFIPCYPADVRRSSYPFFLHWTPDGSRLIFNRFPFPQIFSISSDVPGMRYLANANPANRFWDDWYADVSPDGSQLVYSSCTLPPDFSAWEASDVTYEISVMDADGAGTRDLTATEDQYERLPVWSPGGDRIAYTTTNYIWEERNLSVMDYHRSHTNLSARTIFQSSDNDSLELYPPVWSPDGERIAFITSERIDGDWEKPRYFLNVIAAAGSERERVSETMSLAAWSPDGERIALIRRDGDVTALFTIASDGSEPRMIARIGDWSGYPGQLNSPQLFDIVAWSPDGGRIMYSCQGLCVANVDGSGVAEFSDVNAFKPNTIRAAWSPGGSRIAIYQASIPHFWDETTIHIHILASDGTNLRRILIRGN